MAKSLIRELTIKVNGKDLTKTSADAKKLVDALLETGTASEIINKELKSMSTTLNSITRNANSAKAAFENFSLNNKVKAELNQVLEGINRIKAAAKDLKGMSIGLDLKVGNVSAVQNQISKSLQGLDVSINIKAGNISATNDRLQVLVNNLIDAASSIELINSGLALTKTELAVISAESATAAENLAKVAVSKNLENGLDSVIHVLNNISEEIVQLNLDSKESFNDMVRSIGHVDDSLGAVNKTLHQTKFATRETATGTKNLVEKFDKSGNSLGFFEQKVANATKGMRNQSRVMGDLAKLAGPIPAAFAIISAHVWALTSAFEQLAQGDQLNRLEKMGTIIGANVGVPVQKVAAIMVDATNGAISYENALKKAANASAYGFSTSELEKMTEVARRASVVMGVDMDDALSRIIKGVSKQEIELLDELGITVRLTEAQNNYAKSIGTTADKLSSGQKQQAYLNAVLAQSEKSFGFLTKSDLGATNIEKLGAKFDELTSKAKQAIAELANKTLQKYFGFGSEADTSNSAVANTAKGLESNIKSLQGAYKDKNTLSVIKLINDELTNGNETLTEAKRKVEATGEAYKKLKSAETSSNTLFAPDGMKDSDIALKAYTEGLMKLTIAQEAHNAVVYAGVKYLGLSKESQDAQLIGLGKLADLMQWYEKTNKSASGASENWGQSLAKAGAKVDPLTDDVIKYRDALVDIEDLYTRIDKIEDFFPSISQKTLSDLRAYVDQVSKAAGFSGGRGQVKNALSDANAYQDFQAKHRFDDNTYQQMANVRGGVSGSNEVAIAQQKLTTERERLKLAEANVKNAGKQKEAETQIMEIKKNILSYEGELNNALLTNLQAEQSITELGVKRFAATQAASNMSPEQVTVNTLQAELELQRKNIAELSAKGMAAEQVAALNEAIYEKELQINAAKQNQNIAQIDYNRSLQETSALQADFDAYMSGSVLEIVNSKRAQDDLNAALEKQKSITESFNRGNAGTKASDVVNADQEVLRAKLAKMKAYEAEVAARAQKDSNDFELVSIKNNMGELDILKGKQELESQHLENLRNIHASQTAINEQALKEASVRKQIADLESQRHRDMVQGGIGAIQGENQMQYTSTAGMDSEQAKLASNSDKLANVANSFDQLASYDQPFANVAANLSQMAIAIQDNASAMEIASMAGQSITSMFQMNGQAAVDAIDAQIAAEQKRDGKSAESLAKIKALEAKKIETTRKTARQTIIMQTAVGVANALAMGNPMIGIPMAIAVAAMGMQALKAADSSAEASLAGLDSSTSVESLTLGDRTNKVDTAQKANAGELSYIQGASGTGGIQNFTPRASGSNMYTGHAYVAGEHGPELIVPDVNSVAMSAQSTRSIASGSNSSITLNVHTLDAASFQDLVYSNPNLFRDAVEVALNREGKSLS